MAIIFSDGTDGVEHRKMLDRSTWEARMAYRAWLKSTEDGVLDADVVYEGDDILDANFLTERGE